MLRLFGWLFGFAAFLLIGAIGVTAAYLDGVTKDLPDYTVLKDYQPPVTTRVHAADGTLLAEYAHERRLFQPVETIPPLVIDAFISAEDKDFSPITAFRPMASFVPFATTFRRGRAATIRSRAAVRPSPSRWPRTFC